MHAREISSQSTDTHMLPCIYPIHGTRRRDARNNLPYHILRWSPFGSVTPFHWPPPHTPSFPNSRPASRINVMSSEDVGRSVSLEITNISFLFPPISHHAKAAAWAEKLVYPRPHVL